MATSLKISPSCLKYEKRLNYSQRRLYSETPSFNRPKCGVGRLCFNIGLKCLIRLWKWSTQLKRSGLRMQELNQFYRTLTEYACPVFHSVVFQSLCSGWSKNSFSKKTVPNEQLFQRLITNSIIYTQRGTPVISIRVRNENVIPILRQID